MLPLTSGAELKRLIQSGLQSLKEWEEFDRTHPEYHSYNVSEVKSCAQSCVQALTELYKSTPTPCSVHQLRVISDKANEIHEKLVIGFVPLYLMDKGCDRSLFDPCDRVALLSDNLKDEYDIQIEKNPSEDRLVDLSFDEDWEDLPDIIEDLATQVLGEYPF